MKINSQAKAKDASYPTGWLSHEGAKFKIAGIARPAFQRAFELTSRKVSEDYQNLFNIDDGDAIDSARMQDLVILNYLVIDWEGLEDENGDPLECTTQNKKLLFLNDEICTALVLKVIEKSRSIQVEAEKKKVELLGKLSADSNPTEKAKPTRQSKKQSTKP